MLLLQVVPAYGGFGFKIKGQTVRVILLRTAAAPVP